MLRDMGVDKLVNKAVETVEEEVNAKKNEDAKNKMAGVDEGGAQSPVVARIEGSTSSHPGVASRQAAPPAQAPQALPAPQAAQPAGATVAASAVGSPSAANAAPVSVPSEASLLGAPGGTVQSSGGQTQQLVTQPESADVSVESPAVAPVGVAPGGVAPGGLASQAVPSTAPQYTHFEERMFQTEETVNNLSNTVGELVKTMRSQRSASPMSREAYRNIGVPDPTEDYEAYVGLVSDYMYIRLGDRGAEELLLEGMYKEWASPKVVRDIMDKLSGKKKRRGNAVSEEANMEDRMLVTTLLRNLDKPTNQWSESTHLFMLMALVSRAKENAS
jgi:hypothetical protein